MYVEQLLYNDQPYIKEWTFLSETNNSMFRGRIPNWWHEIRKQIVKNQTTKEINEETQEKILITDSWNNTRILMPTPIDGRHNNWIAGVKNDHIIYGKLITKKSKVRSEINIKIEHYLAKNKDEGYINITRCNNTQCA